VVNFLCPGGFRAPRASGTKIPCSMEIRITLHSPSGISSEKKVKMIVRAFKGESAERAR